jgi:membrane protein
MDRPLAEPPSTWLHPDEPEPKPRGPKPLQLAKDTWNAFYDDDCMTLGAAMAYYTVLSLAPLLLTVVSLAGLVFGREAIQNQIAGQISGLIGPSAAELVQSILKSQARNPSGGIVGTVVGILTILFGASGAFVALQDALNKVWHVQPDPAKGGIRSFVTKRIWSFGVIIGVVFFLIASLVVSAALAAITEWMGGYLPNGISGTVAHTLSFVISLAVIAALFSVILKELPDGRVAWRDAWMGGVMTSVLFTIGKTALAFYLGKAAPGSAYGAAGSLIVVVLWLYYASLILLFGAEFTKIWAASHGREVKPEKGAVRVVTEIRRDPQRAH